MGDVREGNRGPHRTNPDTQPTGIPGVSLRIEKGFHPRVPRSEVETILPDIRAFKQAHALEKLYGGERERLRRRLAPKFRRHRGWKGIESEPDDLKLRADMQEGVVYNARLLRESMSARQYREVVPKEIVIVQFVLPRGVHPDVAIDELEQTAADIGPRAAESLEITIKPADVDEKELARGVRSGKIELKRGAKRVKRTIKLTPESLARNRPKTVTEAAILKPGVEVQVSGEELPATENSIKPFQILVDDPHVIVIDDDGDID